MTKSQMSSNDNEPFVIRIDAGSNQFIIEIGCAFKSGIEFNKEDSSFIGHFDCPTCFDTISIKIDKNSKENRFEKIIETLVSPCDTIEYLRTESKLMPDYVGQTENTKEAIGEVNDQDDYTFEMVSKKSKLDLVEQKKTNTKKRRKSTLSNKIIYNCHECEKIFNS